MAKRKARIEGPPLILALVLDVGKISRFARNDRFGRRYQQLINGEVKLIRRTQKWLCLGCRVAVCYCQYGNKDLYLARSRVC